VSSPLAVAAVTAVLRDLLNNGFIDHDITGTLGQNVNVTAVPPDTIAIDGTNARTQLNLFLHQVTPNAGWRNEGLPSRDGRGVRLANPPLALDLHYLLTAYGSAELHGEILLGYAMHLLHETPVLDRDAIRTALAAGTVDSSILPPAFQALSASDLADQLEQIKIVPETLSTEEMSRLWAALQAHYRPTAAYNLSVVLIEAQRATRRALPVLTRGERDLASGRERGVVAGASLIPPYPMLTALLLPHKQIAAQQGDVLVLQGHNLEGSNVRVRFAHPLIANPIEINVGINANGERIEVTLPDGAPAHAAWAPGAWEVTVVLLRAGELTERSTNALALLLAPRLDIAASSAARDAGTGAVTVTLAFTPQARPGQKLSLNAGGHEALPEDLNAQTGTLHFVFPALDSGPQWLRLRAEGADSLLLDREATPPKFNSTQALAIPA
jgi:Pvc16 N-terminal domain